MFNGETVFATDGIMLFYVYFPVLLKFVILCIGIYFITKIIKFMNAKINLDKERNEKIDELIKIVSKDRSEI
ncbi:hypothetical protein [Bacillus sp. OAE603]|uniref:hypothetical protein n=1 Tax=Gottfriedia sp. OAE603 TaxID=2663872 RepID=UPI00178AF13A